MKKYLTIFILTVIIVPSIALASWWNPFSWNVWDKISSIFNKDDSIEIINKNISNEENTDNNHEVKDISNTQDVNKKPQKQEDCSLLLNTTEKNHCYLNLALLKQDPSICNLIIENEGGDPKGDCLNNFTSFAPYKLFLKSAPVFDTIEGQHRNFSLAITIKNEDVLPFITNIVIDDCEVTGDNNYRKQIYIDSGEYYQFKDKALFPGEETSIEFKGVSLYLPKECSYDDKGIYICENSIEKVKNIASCNFSVSTDIYFGGKFSQTLVF